MIVANNRILKWDRPARLAQVLLAHFSLSTKSLLDAMMTLKYFVYQSARDYL